MRVWLLVEWTCVESAERRARLNGPVRADKAGFTRALKRNAVSRWTVAWENSLTYRLRTPGSYGRSIESSPVVLGERHAFGRIRPGHAPFDGGTNEQKLTSTPLASPPLGVEIRPSPSTGRLADEGYFVLRVSAYEPTMERFRFLPRGCTPRSSRVIGKQREGE